MRHTSCVKWLTQFYCKLIFSQRNSLFTSTSGALQVARFFFMNSLLWKIHSSSKVWFSHLFVKADAIQEMWNAFYLPQVDIVTGTPGKLDDFISTNKINLSQVRNTCFISSIESAFLVNYLKLNNYGYCLFSFQVRFFVLDEAVRFIICN